MSTTDGTAFSKSDDNEVVDPDYVRVEKNTEEFAVEDDMVDVVIEIIDDDEIELDENRQSKLESFTVTLHSVENGHTEIPYVTTVIVKDDEGKFINPFSSSSL